MGIKIRWVKARVGRLIGDVETVGNVEMGEKWVEFGYAERVDATKSPAKPVKSKTPAPVVETADVTEAPVDKVIRAPGERKIAEDPPKQRRRRPRNVADDNR